LDTASSGSALKRRSQEVAEEAERDERRTVEQKDDQVVEATRKWWVAPTGKRGSPVV
jgi:hypothetical protein